jgi:fatty-acyl-CoA synthase
MSTLALEKSYIRMTEPAEFRAITIGGLLREVGEQNADQLALIVPANAVNPERRWTYRELINDAERAAYSLLAVYSPGDRVATWAGGSADILMLHLGAALAGIILVTLNPACRAAEVEYLLGQSKAKGIFADRSFRGLDNESVLNELRPGLPSLERIVYLDQWKAFTTDPRRVTLPDVAPDSPALILFTSGTTGKPKGAVLRHAGLVNNAMYSSNRIDMPRHSIWLNVLPMFHVGGSVTMTIGCLTNHGTQILLPEFAPDAMLDAFERYRVQVVMAVPTMLVAMKQSERFRSTDLSALKVIVTGGTVIVPEIVRSMRNDYGAEAMVIFGQTEAGGVMCMTRRSDDIDRVTQSVGTPLPLSELKIVEGDGKTPAAIGSIGEVCVRTRCAMTEYFGMPEKTRETLDSEGWVHTGDLGVMRPDGYVQVTGRLKDMIIRGGENIYPREIEDVLAEHPAVAQSAVFGLRDEKWGERVAAAVVLKKGASASDRELSEFLQTRIARHKVPKEFHFIDTLPMNAFGKIQKFLLQERFSA